MSSGTIMDWDEIRTERTNGSSRATRSGTKS